MSGVPGGMVDCNDIAELLSAFRDGELEPDEVSLVVHHLARCSHCEELLSEICEVGDRLRETVCWPSLEGFTERVMARITEIPQPFWLRLRNYLGGINWRLPIAITSASLATAVAAITALVILDSRFLRLPIAIHSSVAERTASVQSGAELSESSEHTKKSEVIISRLETNARHVAVWSEPETNTTVIWLVEDTEADE